MSTIVRRPLYQFKLDGEVVELAANPVQNEALEGVITRAVDFELKDQPTLATNVPVDLHLVERVAGTTTPQFSGWTNKRGGRSYPNRAILPCVGPLSRYRRVPRLGDHDLTGMTDGEAWMHVADACDVPYDPDDIQDAGYVLGAIRPIYWLKNQKAHEFIAELDSVFGMATIEIGDGRVIRFAYDRAPDAANIGATYARGSTTPTFWDNQREEGDLDAIVNYWEIGGLSWSTPTDEGGDGCTRTIWAKGDGDNDVLGEDVRNQGGTFQSDIIQDTALAEAVAERMMRWYNRLPDTITVLALNDPNVNCGSVIGVHDDAYGIDLTADADETPYLVLTIDRRGDEMTLNCIGGDPGDTGSITSGVEKVCNATSTSAFDSPPAFTVPPIMVPPAVDSEPDGGGGGDGTDLLGELAAPNWIPDNNIWGPDDPGSYWSFDGSTGEGFVEAIYGIYEGLGSAAHYYTDIPSNTANWVLTIAGTCNGTALNMFAVTVVDNDGGAGYNQQVDVRMVSTSADYISYLYTDPAEDDPTAVLGTGTFRIVLTKTGDVFGASYQSPDGTEQDTASVNGNWAAIATTGPLMIEVVAWNEGSSKHVSITEFSMEVT